jgi:Transposase DDE domain group 1
MTNPTFQLVQSKEAIITPTGIVIAGAIINNYTKLREKLDAFKIPEILDEPGITNSEVLKCYIALLTMGKNDYEAIEEYRGNEFFIKALGIKKVPSSSTLRQRFDMIGNKILKILLDENITMIKNCDVVISPCYKDYIALDMDVSPFDNSKTKKVGVSRTYKGFDGYAPMFAYYGNEGYCLNAELREGKTHCQNGTPEFIKQTLLNAKRLTTGKILVRLDSGNDSTENINILRAEETKADFIIKRNLRTKDLSGWLKLAKEEGTVSEPLEGKKVYIGETSIMMGELKSPERVVYEVIERTFDKKGQYLIEPDVEVATYWTSLLEAEKVIIDLYHAHGTSEQFHSEIKTDIGLERFPSGKFETNELILTTTILAYNLLRIIGQKSIEVEDSPIKKKVQRRRLRTVIQNIITIASKYVKHAGKFSLNFGRYCAWFDTFSRIYRRFAILKC